ncbi:MAG: hypothetical protein C0625_01805 [Arcobacter sp.]|nr:MAG: hypothetical protein C0625_01805 [Arcobacter sp.]
MKSIAIGILSSLFTYFIILPITFPKEISLTNTDHILGFLFVMILFTALFYKLFYNLINKTR